MYVPMQQRRDIAANWTSENPVLLSGEIGIETDTSKFKIGDGATAWTSLSYFGGGGGGGNISSVFGRTGAVVAASGDYTVSQVTGAAPSASPTFTGTPAGPTATPGTNTTQLATTAFVIANSAVASVFGRTGAVTAQSGDYSVGQVTGAAGTASPAFSGTPTTPTATALTNSTQIASTAYTDSAVTVEKNRAQTAEGLALQKASNLSDLGTRQTAMNNLAGAVTTNQFLRGNGSNVVMAAIVAADLPAATTSTQGATIIDGTATDIAASPGTQAAGAVGKVADAGHVHPQPSFFAPTGITGATAATRYVGGTLTGPPLTGTFSVGDWVQAHDGPVWVCTTAGTPGTWTQAGGSAVQSSYLPSDDGLVATAFDPAAITQSGGVPFGGAVYFSRIPIRVAVTATNLVLGIGASNGVGTSSGTFAGLYVVSGTALNLLTGSADIASLLTSGALPRPAVLPFSAAQSLSPGQEVYGAYLVNLANSQPSVMSNGSSGGNRGFSNMNVGSSVFPRFFDWPNGGSGTSALPGSGVVTTSNIDVGNYSDGVWMGLS